MEKRWRQKKKTNKENRQKVEGSSEATTSKMEQNRNSWRSRKSKGTTQDVAPCRKKCES